MSSLALAPLLVRAGCYGDDSTGVAGDYAGNLSYVATGNLAGAAAAEVVVTDDLRRARSRPALGGTATFAVAEGTLIVEHGGTVQLQLGGNLAAPASGYVADTFRGALR
ncbi:MAG TPA: hypothetical protein VGF94_03315 [Kofleriaceae bacterium]|jgi:hypothetical protein